MAGETSDEGDGVLRVPITMGRRDKHSKTALLAALPRVVHFTADRLARGQRVVLCCEVRAEHPGGCVPALRRRNPRAPWRRAAILSSCWPATPAASRLRSPLPIVVAWQQLHR
jgi:hypothetical protein